MPDANPTMRMIDHHLRTKEKPPPPQPPQPPAQPPSSRESFAPAAAQYAGHAEYAESNPGSEHNSHTNRRSDAGSSSRDSGSIRAFDGAPGLVDTRAIKLQKDFRGIKQPSKAHVENAKIRYTYEEGKFHCCITGVSGTGKSSLLNALRGIGDRDPNAALTGTSEKFETLERFPDLRPEYNRFVWYDVPGAGTRNFPKKRYFYENGLFIFDFVILVIVFSRSRRGPCWAA